MGQSVERIHVDLTGSILVYGPDDSEWYVVDTTKATPADYDLMLVTEPTFQPFVISDESLPVWRSDAKRLSREPNKA